MVVAEKVGAFIFGMFFSAYLWLALAWFGGAYMVSDGIGAVAGHGFALIFFGLTMMATAPFIAKGMSSA